MTKLEKNVDKLIEGLKKKESELIQKANFCNEHKFLKEEEWIRARYNIVKDIRFELENAKTSDDYRVYFEF